MPHRKGGENMRIIYSKPSLKNLSQGERISYIRQLRMMSQDEVSDKLGLKGECKRRTMTRYERGDRNPKSYRVEALSKILQVNINSIKQFDFKELSDIIYFLLWLEELIPNIQIEYEETFVNKNKELKLFFEEWERMKLKRRKKEISYFQYTDWKFNYEVTKE